MDVRGGDDLAHLVPGRAHAATAPAHGLVRFRGCGIADDGRPRLDRCQCLARIAPGLDQPATHYWIFDAARAVEVPAIGSSARTPARLVVGHAGPRARIVRLLGLPGNDTALDVDLPAARAGAVHAVGRTHDLVMLPALPVALFPHAIFVPKFAVPARERLAPAGEIGETLEKVAHMPPTPSAAWIAVLQEWAVIIGSVPPSRSPATSTRRLHPSLVGLILVYAAAVRPVGSLAVRTLCVSSDPSEDWLDRGEAWIF